MPENGIPLLQDNNIYKLKNRIILCSDTDEDIARYSVLKENEHLFATKYKLYLPTQEELKAEIERQKTLFSVQQEENNQKKQNT